MQLCKVRTNGDEVRVGVVQGERVALLPSGRGGSAIALSDILHASNPEERAGELAAAADPPVPLGSLKLLAPIDHQEVWAAGVTYQRSQVARREESKGAGAFYDLVYQAPRPELFFKATPHRVVGPGGHVRMRADSRWCVPEPELALVVSPRLELVGYTIGNDMSARDIEGENPLYLPQAKVHDACCALGPVVTLESAMPPPDKIEITLSITRDSHVVFEGATSIARMARRFDELIGWLGRDNSFPSGVILLTGTGIVPPDEFSLRRGDVIAMTITGIGTLQNVVEQRSG